MLAKGSYRFVAAVFGLLGLAFLLSTASIVYEFRDAGWQTMLIAHSHLFIFFPVLGILALVAFYIPSVVFTDLYWHRVEPNGTPIVPYGRQRFAFGCLVATALALYLANVLQNSSTRAIWEVSPAALEQDLRAGPVGQRRPVLATLRDLVEEAGERTSISQFARSCAPDRRMERPESDRAQRYCFPAGAMLDADACCRVQRELSVHVARLWSQSTTRSQAADLDRILLPFKVFFVLVLVVIGAFLILWRRQLREHYSQHLPAIERGIVIGALAMLLWPLMDYGYQQTTDVLFGRTHAGIAVRMSLVIAPWAVLLLLYFVDLGENSERLTQISTVVGAGIAVLRYQEINDISARLLGIGAAWWHFLFIGLFAVVGICAVIWPPGSVAAKLKNGRS